MAHPGAGDSSTAVTGTLYTGDLHSLRRRAALGIAVFLLSLALALFVSAGTFDYLEAWIYLLGIAALVAAITIDLYRQNPVLLDRRLRRLPGGPNENWLALFLATAGTVLVYVVSGLDRRFGWSDVPGEAVFAAEVAVVVGFMAVAAALKANPNAVPAITVANGQTVAAAGPYAVVRHPMYLGVIIAYVSTPVALGSWEGLLPAALISLSLVLRIRTEERFLLKNLPGYREYTLKTRYRLLPGIW
jgi:protein-S-isoprenylcysteine O-methyltransferase Ste14